VNNRSNWAARSYFWLAERLYNELAWIYDPVSWMVSLGQWSTVRKLALDYLTGPRVLEIGFGTGELLLEMARREIQGYGLEYSAAMQRVARSKLRQQNVWLPRVRGRAQQMPFAEGAFDTLVATFPAGYIFELETWREAARVLRKPDVLSGTCGGRFIVVGLGVSALKTPFSKVAGTILGPPLEDMLAHFSQLEQLTGFTLRVVTRRHMALDVPILIAEKRA
jgi:ubiquinone/menaquinone biosynthesis C-methylase UbiE